MERLRRYTDRERIFAFLDSGSIKDLPCQLTLRPEGHFGGAVTVDWSGLEIVVKRSIGNLAGASGRTLTIEQMKSVLNREARLACLHIIEYLPTTLDSALGRLCFESLMVRSSALQRPWLGDIVEFLTKSEEHVVKRRLGIHEGPRPLFSGRSHYEDALESAKADLLAEGIKLTQENVAAKLSKDRDPPVDTRMVRQWNSDYGVDWKAFLKQPLKRTSNVETEAPKSL